MKKNKSKYPLCHNRISSFPQSGKSFKCPICGKRKVWEPNSMVIISGGALTKDGNYYGAPSKGLKGFLNLYWHGAHDNGIGKYRENDFTLAIAENVYGGFFNIAFCSVLCLRKFINNSLDILELNIKKLKPLKKDNKYRKLKTLKNRKSNTINQ